MSNRPWDDISLDLIVSLPKSQDCDAIFVVVDRFSKMVECIPTTTDVTAEQLADLFVQYVVCRGGHGVPKTIISDRDPRFLSEFW